MRWTIARWINRKIEKLKRRNRKMKNRYNVLVKSSCYGVDSIGDFPKIKNCEIAIFKKSNADDTVNGAAIFDNESKSVIRLYKFFSAVFVLR
jgi:hypothetical protein